MKWYGFCLLILIFLLISPASASKYGNYLYNTTASTLNGELKAQVSVNISNSTGTNNKTHVFFNGHANVNYSDVVVTCDDTNSLIPSQVLVPVNLLWVNITSSCSNYKIFYGNSSVTEAATWSRDGGNPVLTATAPDTIVVEDTITVDANGLCNIWYRSSGSERVYYANTTTPDCTGWTNKIRLDDLPSGFFPYVVYHNSTYYMFLQNATSGNHNIWLFQSSNKINWTVMNGGNPVLSRWVTSGLGSVIFNVGVAVDGNHRWHMLIEANDGVSGYGGFKEFYSYSDLTELNWTAHVTASQIFSAASGNPYLKYVPDRGALLALTGDDSGAVWKIRAYTVSLTDNPALSASWHLVPTGTFQIADAGIHDADPDLVVTNGTKASQLILTWGYTQTNIYQQYSNATLNGFYDTLNASGNVSNGGNGETTFYHWDDFNSGGLNTSLWSLTGASPTFNDGKIRLLSTAGNQFINSTRSFATDLIAGTYAQVELTSGHRGWIADWFGYSSFAVDYPTAGQYGVYTYNVAEDSSAIGTGYTGWHTWETQRNGTYSAIFKIDNSIVSEKTAQVYTGSQSARLFSQKIASDGAQIDADYFYIRKKTNMEWNTWGTEQSEPAPTPTPTPSPGPGPSSITIVTDPATSVTSNSVVLNGNLTSANFPVHAYFEYSGSSGSYKYRTSLQTVSSNGTFSAGLSGIPLISNRNYYYRAVAYDYSNANVYGNQVNFMTSNVAQISDYDFDKNFDNLTSANLDPENMTQVSASAYTDRVGSVFWGFLFGLIFLMLWLRSEDVTVPALVGLIIGGSLWAFMPSEWVSLAMSLTVVSLAGLVYSLLKGRQ